MPMKFKLFFLILGFCCLCLAQEQNINGRIIIDLEESSPEGIYITNTRTKLTTKTDLLGGFTIKAQAGDQLLIQSYFYESRKFTITESLMKKDLITIHLNLQPIVLEEAILTPKLTGFLDKDAKYNPHKDQVAKLYKDLGVNPDASKLRDSSNFTMWKDISPLHLNVEKLLEVMTGDLRRRQNLYEYEGKEEKIKQIQAFFGDDYFVLDLEIPREKIREFIFYSFETTSIPTYLENKNFLSIMTELQKKAPEYLKRLKSWNAPLKP